MHQGVCSSTLRRTNLCQKAVDRMRQQNQHRVATLPIMLSGIIPLSPQERIRERDHQAPFAIVSTVTVGASIPCRKQIRIVPFDTSKRQVKILMADTT
jgi:hypothetical protein